MKFSILNFLLSIIILIVAVSSASAQCPPLYIFTGEAGDKITSAQPGHPVDVNNDGYDDILVRLVSNDSAGTDAGMVRVYSGIDGSLLYTFLGEAAGDRFGSAIGGAGDVNNDGFGDIIVGAQWNDAGGTNSGRAYVYSGMDGSLIWTFTGEAAGDTLGHSVSGAGDVNGDGYDDLIVGAYSNDVGGNGAGRAYVYSGMTGAVLYTYTGTTINEHLGIRVSGAGDVNMDGFDDFLIGAHGNDDAGTNAGKAWVYSGFDGTLIYQFSGENANDLFGNVGAAGDVNNDGYADIIVGAEGHDFPGANAGKVYVYSGMDGSLMYEYVGESAGDRFGLQLSGTGDLDDDGYDDFGVWAPNYSIGGPNRGKLYLYSGIDGSIIKTFIGETDGDYLGVPSPGGDINNDGVSDLIFSGTGVDIGGADAGAVYVYTFPTDACFNSIWEASSGDFPNEICPNWELIDTTDTESPTFQGDSLVISTSSDPERMYYRMLGPQVNAIDTFVIEFRMRFLGGTSQHSSQSGAKVWSTIGGQANVLSIEVDEIFIWSALNVKGATVTVDTDNEFHTYRLEFANTAVSVYYDDALVISGSTFPYSTPDSNYIFFGESTSIASGTSKWLYVKHNAYAFGSDVDSDGVIDSCDNCIDTPNPDQADANNDGIGDACCCIGNRGDLNGDGADANILDLTFAVDRIFRGGGASGCPAEADVNGDGNPHNVLDLTFLVDRIFRGGGPPGPCL